MWSCFSWSEDGGLELYVVNTPAPSRRHFLLSNCPAPISSCNSYPSFLFGETPRKCGDLGENSHLPLVSQRRIFFTPTSCFLAKPKACDLGSVRHSFLCLWIRSMWQYGGDWGHFPLSSRATCTGLCSLWDVSCGSSSLACWNCLVFCLLSEPACIASHRLCEPLSSFSALTFGLR